MEIRDYQMTHNQIIEINECIGFCFSNEKFRKKGLLIRSLLTRYPSNHKLLPELLYQVYQVNYERGL